MCEATTGRWSRRIRLTTAPLLVVAALVAADGASGWWPFASPSPATEPANGGPVLTGVIYSWRGLLMQLARTSSRNSNNGLLVEQVEPNSPAANAKLKPGDIITAVDGITVNSARSLAMAIADHCCGPTAVLSITRDHEPRRIELPPAALASAAVAARTVERGIGWRTTHSQWC